VGLAPELVFSSTDAIFEPLAARQVESARRQQLQAATNDTTLSVAQAYFGVQEARGNLAGVQDTIRRTNLMLKRIESLAPELVPSVEVTRARAQLAHFEQTEESTREHWNVASASLVRILRMNPATVVEPAEAPHMMLTLVSPDEPVENLLSLALANRPELAATRDLAQAAQVRWNQERFRPFLPNVYARGNSGQVPVPLAFSGFGGSTGGSIGRIGTRDDFEVQVMWELRNLGFGNAAFIRGRRAEFESSRMQAFRAQDVVAQEVVQALAQLRSAAGRVSKTERELKEAIRSAEENYVGLSETKRVGANINLVVIRPQEAIASAQALLQAYFDYFGAVADFNRAEFGLYRALGNPAQLLAIPEAPVPAAPPAVLPEAPNK
jgi:outer membrane protein TolC